MRLINYKTIIGVSVSYHYADLNIENIHESFFTFEDGKEVAYVAYNGILEVLTAGATEVTEAVYKKAAPLTP